jgi:TonB-linked SusC/RagA family outer membrane protein
MGKKLLMVLTCFFMFAGMTFAQKKVSGTVYDRSTGEPIIGATVRVKGTTLGVATNVDGQFEFDEVPDNSSVLHISYVGMEPAEVVVKSRLKVYLSPAVENIDDVIVVAYGTQKKESLTGAVSQINAEDIENRLTTSVTGALEGAAPGVQVNNTYGEPGSAPSIRIRGFSSMEANSPLYVVDGAAFDGNIAELNPNDIESMSVLKDAAATALYGNRASNGVILITTKRGSGNANPTITFKTNQGYFTRGLPEYERLGADKWMETSWQAMKNYAMSGSMALDAAAAADYATKNLIGDYVRVNIYDAADDQLFDANGKLIANMLPGYAGDLDWADDIERAGHRQEYNLSASATSQKFSIYSSLGYMKENGYMIATDYERYSARINSTYTPTSWLKTGVNLSGVATKSNYNTSATSNYYKNPFYITRYMAPVYALHAHNADGTYALDAEGNKQYDLSSVYLDNRNIAYELREDKQYSRRNVINAQAFATVNLPYDFSFTVKGDISNATTNNQKYDNPFIGDGANKNGRLTSYAYQYTNYTFQQMLNWDHSFGLHNISALVGHENYSWVRRYTYAMNTGAAVEGNLVMGNFLTPVYSEGHDDEDKTESYLGRVSYNYDEKYYGELSFRRDGSSRFYKDNRWGNFYSAGARWNMKKEAFLQDVDWVDNLSLRASYGEVGNNAAVGLYAHMALYYMDKNGGNPASYKQALAAEDLKWETAQTIDFAVEGRLFNKLNFSVGYFDKRSKDLLFAVPLPLSAGSWPWGDSPNMEQLKNIGTISNKGLEIALDYDVIKNRDWKWNVGVDATFLKNELVKLPGGDDITKGTQRCSEGHSIYEFYTYHFEGVDQMTGNSLYTIDPEKTAAAEAAGHLVTINGKDYTTDTSFGKKDWAGTALPDVYGSFKSSLSWKDLSLDVLFTYALGGKVYDGAYQSLMSTSSASSASAMHKDLTKSWNGVPEGMTETSANRIDKNGTPIVDFTRSTYNNATSDRWLEDASYLVCKNITLGYTIPKAITNSWGVGTMTLNAGVENLFTLTARKGLNPQYSFNGGYDDTYVTARVWNLGVTLNF